MYDAVSARLLNIKTVEDLRDALTTKAMEEEEPEFNAMEKVRDILARYHYDFGKQEVNQAEVFTAARQQAKEYGQDISSEKFGAIIRDLGFRPGKNVNTGKRDVTLAKESKPKL